MSSPLSVSLPRDASLTEFADQVVRLCDGRAGLRRGLSIDVREPKMLQNAPPIGAAADAPVLDFIASSELPDRYEEVLSAAGWRLENYRRNPVFKNAHQ